MRSVMWKELTAEDLRAKAAENAVVILPVASMEQHDRILGGLRPQVLGRQLFPHH